jgi:hypothetical protein
LPSAPSSECLPDRTSDDVASLTHDAQLGTDRVAQRHEFRSVLFRNDTLYGVFKIAKIMPHPELTAHGSFDRCVCLCAGVGLVIRIVWKRQVERVIERRAE